MSELYDGTDLQIETIDSKPYLLQVRAVYPDGSRGEWGPTAYLPEYVAAVGSVRAFDGTLEQYTNAADAVSHGWKFISSGSFSAATLDTTGKISDQKSIEVTTSGATGDIKIVTPAFDVYAGTAITWAFDCLPQVRGQWRYRVVAYWSASAADNPQPGDNEFAVYPETAGTTDLILPGTGSVELFQTGSEFTVPETARRMSFAIIFTISGGTYPQSIWVDNIALTGIERGPVSTTDDQIIAGRKYFTSIAASDAVIDNLSAFQSTLEIADITTANVQILNVGGGQVEKLSKKFLLTGDYPREAGVYTLQANEANFQNLNSLSFYPPYNGTPSEDPYLATIIWSGWTNIDVSSQIAYYLQIQTDPLGEWTNIRKFNTDSNPRASGILIARRLISSEYVGIRVIASTTANVNRSMTVVDRAWSNDLSVVLEDATADVTSLPSFKPTSLTYSTGGYDGVNGELGTSATRYSSTLKGTFGWKESYKAGGTRRFDSERIYQGYLNDNYGNQKSAVGNITWTGTQPPVGAIGVRVVSCFLNIKPLSWYNSTGGTLVLGTHQSNATSIPSDWSSIAGKNPDRRRVTVRGVDQVKRVDLGPGIGLELFSGSEKGLLLGPGPTQAKDWFGSFASANTALWVDVRLEWYIQT